MLRILGVDLRQTMTLYRRDIQKLKGCELGIDSQHRH